MKKELKLSLESGQKYPMKKLLLAVCLGLVVAAVAYGAEKVEWLTDLPKALAKAKAEKKLVLLEFTGSDWCPPCKELKKTVLSSPAFEAYAQTNLVLVELDYPHDKQQTEELKKANADLAKKYEIEGFPTVIVLNADAKEVHKMIGYGGQTAKEFIADLEKVRKKSK